MRLVVVTPPAAEPLTLAEAKEHLRVEADFTRDDDVISRQLTTARIKVESLARQSLVTTTYDLYLDGWPCGRTIDFPVGPLVSVSTVVYLDADDAEQTLSSSAYRVSTGLPGSLSLKRSESWPTAPVQSDAIRVRFVAGYGAAAAVPTNLKDAILLVLANLYENRGESDAALSRTVRDLVAPSYCGRRP